MNYSLDTLLYGMQFRRLLEKEMRPVETKYGLQKVDMQVMLYLRHAGEHNTLKDIMRLNMFTKGHISQSLSRLREKGYVRMEQDTEDRRCTHNYLTEEADLIIGQIEKISGKIREITLEGVTEEEREILVSIAQRMNENINRVL
ncbi:MarR family winged helix-turn-helix transcriptional regulator [Ruminococcus sp. CLA-AA-H200]|uniref:MarR family winged helix-turn-helix transcriptional regulator n=1 Tax=Ruminococcus turbiniformis TaxID=2881258 RepID=A0ABS8G2U9_9FIRM|nr:MarR family winged helix-turn-helix transcriptional regulator [Ruminococcus turbiniformis]MCC2256209.1 MarR family winged helix-turn-helix transcriptional regulator [Ruminococcus turbiniformis]